VALQRENTTIMFQYLCSLMDSETW